MAARRVSKSCANACALLPSRVANAHDYSNNNEKRKYEPQEVGSYDGVIFVNYSLNKPYERGDGVKGSTEERYAARICSTQMIRTWSTVKSKLKMLAMHARTSMLNASAHRLRCGRRCARETPWSPRRMRSGLVRRSTPVVDRLLNVSRTMLNSGTLFDLEFASKRATE